jgi:hypothetical protein
VSINLLALISVPKNNRHYRKERREYDFEYLKRKINVHAVIVVHVCNYWMSNHSH